MNSEKDKVPEAGVRLAVDIGGTFTDVVLEHSGKLISAKLPTKPSTPEGGFVQGGSG